LLCFLFMVVAMWGVTCQVQKGIGEKTHKKQGKNKQTTQKNTQKQVSPSEKPMLIRKGTDKREKDKEKGGKKKAEGQGWHRRVEERDGVS
jgi:hypothetical protein